MLTIETGYTQSQDVHSGVSLQFPSPLTAADIATADNEALSRHLDNLLENAQLTPQQITDDAKFVLAYAIENNLVSLEINAASVVITSLIKEDQKTQLQAMVDRYLPKAVNQDAKIPLSRIYRTLLRATNLDSTSERGVAIRRQLLGLIEKGLPPRHVGLAFLSIGMSDFYNNRFYSALIYLEKSLASFQRLNLPMDADKALSMLAVVNSRLGNEQRAIDIQLQIIERMRSRPKSITWSIIDYNIASAYFDLDEFSLARNFAMRSKSIAEDFDDDSSIAYAELLLSEIAYAMDDFETALSLSKDSQVAFERLGKAEKQAEALITRIKSEVKLNQLVAAEESLTLLEVFYAEILSDALAIAMLEVKAMLSEANKDYQQSLSLYRDFSAASLKEQQKSQMRLIDRLMNELAVDVEETETRFQAQRETLAALELQVAEQRKQLISLVSIIVALIVGIAGVLFYQRARFKKAAESNVRVDELTQAPNRLSFFEAAKLAFNRNAIEHSPTVIAAIDLDNFQQLHSTYGHEVGDHVLRKFAEYLEGVLREQDNFGRTGGAEWLLVFPQTDIAHMRTVFDSLRASCQGMTISKEKLSLTFSMGAVSTLEGYANIESMISAAEKLVLKAKSKGKDRLEVSG